MLVIMFRTLGDSYPQLGIKFDAIHVFTESSNLLTNHSYPPVFYHCVLKRTVINSQNLSRIVREVQGASILNIISLSKQWKERDSSLLCSDNLVKTYLHIASWFELNENRTAPQAIHLNYFQFFIPFLNSEPTHERH